METFNFVRNLIWQRWLFQLHLSNRRTTKRDRHVAESHPHRYQIYTNTEPIRSLFSLACLRGWHHVALVSIWLNFKVWQCSRGSSSADYFPAENNQYETLHSRWNWILDWLVVWSWKPNFNPLRRVGELRRVEQLEGCARRWRNNGT